MKSYSALCRKKNQNIHVNSFLTTVNIKVSTMTLSKFSGQVEDARRPSLFSFLQISRPIVSRSTMKHVIPLYPY